jgi:hypothetical protein
MGYSIPDLKQIEFRTLYINELYILKDNLFTYLFLGRQLHALQEILHGLKVSCSINIRFIFCIKLGRWVFIVESFPETVEKAI